MSCQFQDSEVERFIILAIADFWDHDLADERTDFRRRIRQIVWAGRIVFEVTELDHQLISARGDVRHSKRTVAVTKGAETFLGSGRLEKTICRRDIGFGGGKIGALGTRAGLLGCFQSELDGPLLLSSQSNWWHQAGRPFR